MGIRNRSMQENTGGNSLLTVGQKTLLTETYQKLLKGDDIIIDMHPARYSLHHAIIHLCELLQGDVDILLSTFSISEEVLNSFVVMKEKKLLKSISVIIDKNFATKTSPLLFYAGTVLDNLFLAYNHTKIAVLSKNGEPRYLITGSANLNYNPRWEYYIVTANYCQLKAHMELLLELNKTAVAWK